MDTTQHLNTVFTPTSLAPADAAAIERDGFASESSAQSMEEVWPAHRRRDDLEALGLVLGVLSILLALAVGLTPELLPMVVTVTLANGADDSLGIASS